MLSLWIARQCFCGSRDTKSSGKSVVSDVLLHCVVVVVVVILLPLVQWYNDST